MKFVIPIVIVCGVVVAAAHGFGHEQLPHQPANLVDAAVRAGSGKLGVQALRIPACSRSDGWDEWDCGDDVHCSVDWDVSIAGRRTDFFYCDRPTGDPFDYVEVCVVRSRGKIAVDRSRTAALDGGPDFPCPYRWES
jgi:hypothetical protein